MISNLVDPRTDRILRQQVKLMPVHDQVFLARYRCMLNSLMERDVAEDVMPDELCHELIVIAIDVMDNRPLPSHLQDSFNDLKVIILLLWVHVKDLLEPPYVNDIPNQIQMIKFVFFEELVQFLGAAFLGCKVKVRQKDCSVVHTNI
jgi:hypothetical protein